MAYLEELTDAQKVEIALRPADEDEVQIQTYRRFYDGFQGATHTEDQDSYLGPVDGKTEPDSFGNICRLVVGVVRDRLRINQDGMGITPGDKESESYAAKASDWWVRNGLNSLQVDLYEHILKDGKACLVIEWDEARNMPLFSVNKIWDGDWDADRVSGKTARQVMGIRYFRDSNGKLIYAAKLWLATDLYDEGNRVARLNIYEPGRISRYILNAGDSVGTLMEPELVTLESGGAVTQNPQPFPIDVIPIILFENSPDVSELYDVLKPQKVLNRRLGTIDIGSDYHGYPMLTAEEFAQRLDSQGNEIGQEIGPQKMVVGRDVRRVDPPNLAQMWDGSVKEWIKLVALVKRWPIWVLDNQGGFSVPSGTSLKKAEGPLVSQIKEKQAALTLPWQAAFDIARQLHNIFNKSDSIDVEETLKLIWESPAPTSILEDREAEVKTATEAGWSKETMWREIYGWDDDRVEKEYERLSRQERVVNSVMRQEFDFGGIDEGDEVESPDDSDGDDEGVANDEQEGEAI